MFTFCLGCRVAGGQCGRDACADLLSGFSLETGAASRGSGLFSGLSAERESWLGKAWKFGICAGLGTVGMACAVWESGVITRCSSRILGVGKISDKAKVGKLGTGALRRRETGIWNIRD